MKKWLYLLSIIPVFFSLLVINKVEPYVLGMPFILFWMVLWLVLTSVFMWIVFKLDPANQGGDDE
ncbi:DUF3311 domain-containing protein [Brevibacillus reuszeri]|uniref:DUF3311 domain-containing protein n=1 Tax=Brevibacillus reuszeri TaxID=54915 RepID=UPI00289A72AC|nr:DUF3311 domain-containing protein [Brevibacillus reuszeri]